MFVRYKEFLGGNKDVLVID